MASFGLFIDLNPILYLNSEWSTTSNTVHIGGPLTLTMTLRVTGAMGEQLPDLS